MDRCVGTFVRLKVYFGLKGKNVPVWERWLLLMDTCAHTVMFN